ncbi:MAG: hypothetical protein A2Z93_14765 [Curvibacter sp. GWA2_64_110]|nr:MAG: hypothetical protein A2Z93_14765 [Curvibacter sp. GWA2_64_110]HCY16622.1 hypothetical protein [Curvibacter sp.]
MYASEIVAIATDGQTPVNRLVQKIFARFFAIIFLLLSAFIMLSTFSSALDGFLTGSEGASQIIIKVVNDCIIAIAVFELAMVINKEYGHESQHDVAMMLRRTLPRFIGTVCVALSLEGLIMVIKYSQFDRAGNLYYAIGTVVSSALLLTALGLFLKFAPTE